MNERDATFATIIDKNTIVVDCRNMRCQVHTQAGIVRAIGDRHFNGEYKNDDEAFTRILHQDDGLHVYHVDSVQSKMWVVSKKALVPEVTIPIVTEYVEANPKKK